MTSPQQTFSFFVSLLLSTSESSDEADVSELDSLEDDALEVPEVLELPELAELPAFFLSFF